MSQTPGLFTNALISPEVLKALKPGFLIRPLEPSDYEKGFLETLGHLTTVGKQSKEQFMDRYSYLQAHSHEYFTIVCEDLGKQKIVGAGTIFIERKFVHNNGLVGHVEDIVTDSQYRGLNLGKLLIETLKYIGQRKGCYKIILDCSDKNVPFYQKCGFVHKEYEMVLYIPENDTSISKL